MTLTNNSESIVRCSSSRKYMAHNTDHRIRVSKTKGKGNVFRPVCNQVGDCFIVWKLRRSVLEGRKATILVVKAKYAGLPLKSLKTDWRHGRYASWAQKKSNLLLSSEIFILFSRSFIIEPDIKKKSKWVNWICVSLPHCLSVTTNSQLYDVWGELYAPHVGAWNGFHTYGVLT
jgi:hypothetical protein